MASKTCSSATTSKATQGASATTRIQKGVAILKTFRKDHGSVCCSKDLEFLIIVVFL
jgi:hypothetical protein